MDLKKMWHETFEGSVKSSLYEIKCKYLDTLGLEVEEIPHVFTERDKDCFAIYLHEEDRLKDGKIVFALNRERIYSRMKRLLLHRNRKNTAMQARILVFHEVGHGLIEYMRSLDLTETGRYTSEVLATTRFSSDEENIVIQFGRHSCERDTLEFESVLEKAVIELIEMKSTENN